MKEEVNHKRHGPHERRRVNRDSSRGGAENAENKKGVGNRVSHAREKHGVGTVPPIFFNVADRLVLKTGRGVWQSAWDSISPFAARTTTNKYLIIREDDRRKTWTRIDLPSSWTTKETLIIGVIPLFHAFHARLLDNPNDGFDGWLPKEDQPKWWK